MIIGLCGTGFPAVRDALRAALPEAELVDVSSEAVGTGPMVDVLAPLGAVVDGGLMDTTQPRLIQQFGVGLQGVDLSAARDRAIPVAYVPASETGNATAVAEIVFLHLLSLLRRYRAAQHSLAERRVGQPIGTSLSGKTVTVLGAGGIGTEVVSRLTAFDAVPLVVGRRALSDYPDTAPTVSSPRCLAPKR